MNGKDSSDLKDAVPAAGLLAGTWLCAGAFDDSGGRTAAWAMTEAAAFSTAAAYLFKAVAGRIRHDARLDLPDMDTIF